MIYASVWELAQLMSSKNFLNNEKCEKQMIIF